MEKTTANKINESQELYFVGNSVLNSRIIPENVDCDVEAKAQALRKYINDLQDTLETKSNCRYVSLDGSPENDGSSPEKAWDSLETLEKNRKFLKSGEKVLFRRGDIFRGSITVADGVSYGAYGKGEKPRIYGSFRDYIFDDWIEVETGVWTIDCDFPSDVGNIIFDYGRAVGNKCINREDMCKPFDYWCDHKNGNRFYILMDRNPKEIFKSIEIAHELWLFRLDGNINNVTVENIAFGYCGGHGIRARAVENISIRGCEFAFIGGSFLTAYKDGIVRYGNAIEFMNSCKNVSVRFCIAHQIYDSGITHQGYGDYRAENLDFSDNLLEYCGMGSIEYWLGQYSKCINVSYSNNIMRFAGYGFGGIQRPDKNMTSHIQSNGACINDSENFIIENNIFELSTYDLVNAQSSIKTLPVLRGNTYIQNKEGRLGSYSEYLNYNFDDDVANVLATLWQDTNARIKSIDRV